MLRLIGMGINAVFVAALIGIGVFWLTIAVGWVDGYALPNTAFFRLFPRAERLALLEPFLGHVVLMLACVGFGCSWISSLNAVDQEAFQAFESKLAAAFRRFGLMALVGAFLFSIGAAWAGIPRSQDLSSSAIAGLLPFNDAHGHFVGPALQSMNGVWEPFVERRPLAIAFRTVLVAATGFDNYYFLMLQTVLLAVASYFAISAVTNWRGVWAGMTFFGLTFIAVRPYLPTNLTEPLALFWALVSVPFIVGALRGNEQSQASVALYTTCWALLIRMGSMFTIPALGLWVIIAQPPGRRRWIIGTVGVVGVLLVSVLLSGALKRLYGTEQGMTGSNFSYVICGLTHNTDWAGCSNLYASELNALPNEAEASKFLYGRAVQKFVDEPTLLFRRLWDGEKLFLSKIANVVLSGYTGTIPSIFPQKLWGVLVVGGVLWVLSRHRERHELAFWFLILVSIVLSAPFVIFDDGWRTLCTSFILSALLIASGFATPTTFSSKEMLRQFRWLEWIGISVIVLPISLCLIIPGLSHRLDLLGSKRYVEDQVGDDEDIFLGGGRMSGFLVLPDGVAPLKQVPSISYSSFSAIVRNSGIEQYGPLLASSSKVDPPFGILAAISVKKKQPALLIAPPDVLTRTDVPAWRLRYISGPMWHRVVEAAAILH